MADRSHNGRPSFGAAVAGELCAWAWCHGRFGGHRAHALAKPDPRAACRDAANPRRAVSPFAACAGGARLAYCGVSSFAHVLPQYVVGLILLFPHAILHEASITFLGFGLSPEQPAIGVILSEAMGYLTAGAWWLAVIPGVALLVVVLLFDRIGSCVRRLIAPEGVQL